MKTWSGAFLPLDEDLHGLQDAQLDPPGAQLELLTHQTAQVPLETPWTVEKTHVPEQRPQGFFSGLSVSEIGFCLSTLYV